MFTQRPRSPSWRRLRARRAIAGQIYLLALALGVGALAGCVIVSIASVRLISAHAAIAQATVEPTTSSTEPAVQPTAPVHPTFSPSRTPQAAETPRATTTVEPTTTAEPARTATAEPTAPPEHTATAVPPPAVGSQPPPPTNTSTGGHANLTLLGLIVFVLCCAVTGIIVWLAATRHRQPPVSDRQPPATD